MVCAASALFGMAACGSSSADGEKKIRIGIKYDQPGLGFKKSGTFEGFDVDVARYVANQLGYTDAEIEFLEAPSKQREAMLQNGDVDMILATYSITDERKKGGFVRGAVLRGGAGSNGARRRPFDQRSGGPQWQTPVLRDRVPRRPRW